MSKNLADYLKNQHTYSVGVDLVCTPIFQRESRFLPATGAFIEVLCDTTAKKRRYFKTVLQPSNNLVEGTK